MATGLLPVALLVAGCAGQSPAPGAAAAPGTQVLAALILDVNTKALSTAANESADPHSQSFGQFLPVHAIASRYGAPTSEIEGDLRLLTSWGIHFAVDPTHAALWGSVTATQVRQRFGTSLIEVGGVVEPATSPSVPSGLVGVAGIVGLVRSLSATGPAAGGASGTAQPACPATLPSTQAMATLFGFTTLVAEAHGGAGATVAILSGSRLLQQVFTNFSRCAGVTVPFDVTNHEVPLTNGAAGGPEVALDSIVLRLLAPESTLENYQFDTSAPLAFPLMDLLTETTTTPNVVDVTENYCEEDLGDGTLKLSEWLLATLALTGTTVIVAAGDDGSSGCHPQTDQPLVLYPASSQFVTAMGGASYEGSASAPADLRAWNVPGTYGGGGGTSTRVPAPPWQGGTWRRLPDVSAYAPPGGVGSIPVCTSPPTCDWESVGGTSLSATVLSAAAVLAAGQGDSAKRWGNLAGRLWRVGASDAAWTDVTAGSNTTFAPACCQAGPSYDLATGWGLFNPDGLRSLLGTAASGP